MTLADAFTIFVAVGTLGTILLGRLALGASERLSGREVLAGIIALAGVTVIAHGRQTTDALFQRTFASYNTTESDTQPQRQRIRPWSSAAADDHEMPSGPMLLDSGTGSQLVSTSTAVIGVSICIMGGVASAVFNILTCASPNGGPNARCSCARRLIALISATLPESHATSILVPCIR